MSIEQGDPARSTGEPIRIGLLLVGVVAFVIVASALLSVVLVALLQSMDTGVADAILGKGPHKLMRRVMIVLAIPFVPYLLRRAGWRGWRDCGWATSGDRIVDRNWRRDALLGMAAGGLTLGMISILQLGFGAREWNLDADPIRLLSKLASIAVAALVIGCLEETLVRGVLFRVLDRLWSFWPAALVSSLLFAYGHYLEPDPSAFEGGGVLERTWHVLLSTFAAPARTDHFLVNVANIALMGFVLCTVVYRTGTVWMAVGLHAAWVALIKFNFFASDVVRDAPFSIWMGQRADATDAVITSVVLTMLAYVAGLSLPLENASNET